MISKSKSKRHEGDKMDEEHSRENLQKEEKNIEERTVTEDKTEESSSAGEANGEEIATAKPIAREAWNAVYSREKRLEELRRRRMEAASKATNQQKKDPKQSVQNDDHSASSADIEKKNHHLASETETCSMADAPENDTEEKTVEEKPKKSSAKSVPGGLNLEKIKKQLRRNITLWKSEREMQKKRHANIRTELTPQEYGKYLVREWFGGEWKTSIITPILGVGVLILCMNMIQGAAGKSIPEPETEIQTESETAYVYPEKDITIGSTGCMLLHSPFIDSYPDAEGNYDFSTIYKYITPYYSAPDFMTCEFEGSLAGPDAGYSGYPLFLSPDVIIENIKDSGVDLQFLATNHVYDGGSDGFHRTMQVYDEKNIAFSGIRENSTAKQYVVEDINGVKVGFIDYVYETDGTGTNLNGIPLAEDDWDLVNSFDYNDLDSFYKEMQSNIASMKSEGAQFIIAQMHWGIEYQLEEADYQDEMAQKLCDLGVNAIIGGHPHCEQPIDVLDTSDGSGHMFCIYSEGNALSNQRTYLMDEMPTGHTEDGVMVTLTLHQNSDGSVEIKDVDLLPTWVYRYQDNDGSKYYILPLDDVENLEKTTGISDIQQEAQDSYDRTMEELGPGLEKAKQIFGGSSVSTATADNKTSNTGTGSSLMNLGVE